MCAAVEEGIEAIGKSHGASLGELLIGTDVVSDCARKHPALMGAAMHSWTDETSVAIYANEGIARWMEWT